MQYKWWWWTYTSKYFFKIFLTTNDHQTSTTKKWDSLHVAGPLTQDFFDTHREDEGKANVFAINNYSLCSYLRMSSYTHWICHEIYDASHYFVPTTYSFYNKMTDLEESKFFFPDINYELTKVQVHFTHHEICLCHFIDK